MATTDKDKIYNIDSEVKLGDCYLWQYDKAEKLNSLLNAKKTFYKNNVEDFWDNFQTKIFNIDTAETFGLNLWGLILSVPRPTYTEGGQTIEFTDDQYRLIIKSRLMMMNSNGSIHDLNAYLDYLFPGKSVFTVDYHDMSVSLVFFYTPTAAEMAVILNDGFLPRPAGVQIKYRIVPPAQTFGFDGSGLSGFDQGSFLS